MQYCPEKPDNSLIPSLTVKLNLRFLKGRSLKMKSLQLLPSVSLGPCKPYRVHAKPHSQSSASSRFCHQIWKSSITCFASAKFSGEAVRCHRNKNIQLILFDEYSYGKGDSYSRRPQLKSAAPETFLRVFCIQTYSPHPFS